MGRGPAMLLAGMAGLSLGVVATHAAAPGVTPDRNVVERIVHDYLLAHPEVLAEALGRLQERQAAGAIGTERAALETPFAGAWAGSAAPKVTLVMFSDYACGYCRQSVPDIERLLAEEPGLRVVWREIPILGAPSTTAARTALAAAKAGRYLPLHRALFAGGRPSDAAIAAAVRVAGLDPAQLAEAGKGEDVTREIANNLKLAGRLGVDGTPAFVVGGRMLNGAVGYEALKQAVAAASRG